MRFAEVGIDVVMQRQRSTTAANLRRLAAWARREALTSTYAPTKASAERLADRWAREALDLDLQVRVDELNALS